MTVDTLSVPPPAASSPPGPVVGPPAPGRPSHPARCRSVVRRCVLVPLVVLLPLITLTPSADHRFNVYSNGGLCASHPWRMIGYAVESVPQFLRLGNFR